MRGEYVKAAEQPAHYDGPECDYIHVPCGTRFRSDATTEEGLRFDEERKTLVPRCPECYGRKITLALPRIAVGAQIIVGQMIPELRAAEAADAEKATIIDVEVSVAPELPLDQLHVDSDPILATRLASLFVRLAVLAREDERLAALLDKYAIRIRHGENELLRTRLYPTISDDILRTRLTPSV